MSQTVDPPLPSSLIGRPATDSSGSRSRWDALGIEPGLTSIIILTMNECACTRLCVESIARHTSLPHELIFVDNGSTDDTLDYLATIDGATVIANAANNGFGGGCNQGIAASRGDRILLLNNDTVVTSGWLEALAGGLDAHPRRGIVGPRSNSVTGVQQVNHVDYDEESLEGLDAFAMSFTTSRTGAGEYLPRLIGFCLLIRRAVIDHIGGFDVRFGLGNFEDDDLCLRAAVAGWGLWMCDDAFIHHFGSRTFTGAGIDYNASIEANWERFARTWRIASQTDDLGRRSYLPGPIIESTRFDAARHYAPIVAVVDDGAEVTFDRRSIALLVAMPPERPEELRKVFAACCARFSAADDLTVVIRIAPSDDMSLTVLDEVADAIGDSELPDIVVVQRVALNDQAIIRVCDIVVCAGRDAYALDALARYEGVTPLTVDEMSAGTWV